MSYPLKHISIRVPWHDTAWDGRVCAAPRLNGACLKLKRIAEGYKVQIEAKTKDLDRLRDEFRDALEAES